MQNNVCFNCLFVPNFPNFFGPDLSRNCLDFAIGKKEGRTCRIKGNKIASISMNKKKLKFLSFIYLYNFVNPFEICSFFHEIFPCRLFFIICFRLGKMRIFLMSYDTIEEVWSVWRKSESKIFSNFATALAENNKKYVCRKTYEIGRNWLLLK